MESTSFRSLVSFYVSTIEVISYEALLGNDRLILIFQGKFQSLNLAFTSYIYKKRRETGDVG